MKAFLVLLLGAVLCLDSGFSKPQQLCKSSSLTCYSCKAQLSNSNCKTSKECKNTEMCKTDVIRIIGLFNVISKDCDASCTADYQDFSVGNRNVSCCSTDFCNTNAAGSMSSRYGLSAGLAGSVLWTFLNSRL